MCQLSDAQRCSLSSYGVTPFQYDLHENEKANAKGKKKKEKKIIIARCKTKNRKISHGVHVKKLNKETVVGNKESKIKMTSHVKVSGPFGKGSAGCVVS